VASEQLISGDRLDNLSSSTAGRLKEEARTLVGHIFFSRSMDLTTLSTKEPGKNENIDAGSGGNQAVCGGKGGIGGEAEALLALEALSEKMSAEASALTKAAKAAM
jgi:hypothetical protein